MRQSLKVALSLLIAIVLFSGFAVLAFSGLFDLLAVTFWNPRVENEIASSLNSLAGKIVKYHDLNIQRFTVPLEKPYAASAFQTVQLKEDIQARVSDFGAMQKDLPELVAVRFLDPDGKKLHFSTLSTDLMATTATGIEYKMLDMVDSTIAGKELVVGDGKPAKVVLDGVGGRLIYALPIYQSSGSAKLYKGTGLFYVGTNDLLSYLLRIPQTNVGSLLVVGSDGVLLNFPGDAGGQATDPLTQSVDALWKSRAAGDAFHARLPLTLSRAGGSPQAFTAFFTPIPPYGFVSVLIPQERFEMTQAMKGLLLASFFFTVFLIVFLLFNLRPDPLEVLSHRIKRFQIQLLEQIMESPGGVDWARYRRELEARKGEITSQIEHGLGRVSARQKPQVDALLGKSWDEILDLLGRRAEAAPPSAPPIDVSRLESLIKQALSSARFVIPAEKAVKPSERLSVEELPVEEVEELPAEASEEIEEAEEAEELSEAEAVEEAPAKAEPVEELPAEAEPGEAEAVEEAPAEAEPVEELESLVQEQPTATESINVEPLEAAPLEAESAEGHAWPRTQRVEELPEEPALAGKPAFAGTPEGAVGPQQGPVAASLGVDEDLPLLEAADLEELEEAPGERRRVHELVEVRVPSRTAVELAFPEIEEAPAIEASEENLEELETISEIMPLPPEPVEEGLELLPLVDEAPERLPVMGNWRIMEDVEIGADSFDLQPMIYKEAGTMAEDSKKKSPKKPKEQEVGAEESKRTSGGKAKGSTQDQGRPKAGADMEVQATTQGKGPDEAGAKSPAHAKGQGLLKASASRAKGARDKSSKEKEFEHIQKALEEPGQEDLEELEEVSDAAEAAASAKEAAEWTLSDQNEEISRLVAAGTIVTYSMEQLVGLVQEAKSAIVIQDGVFRIKDDVYASAERSKDLKLKELADEIMKHDRSEGPPLSLQESNDGLSGIGDLIREEETIDLAKEVETEKDTSAPEVINMEREKSWPLHFKKNGIDYDEFLSSYPRSFTHTSQMKSLVEISRRAFAVCSGILLKKHEGYVLELAVGANEKTYQLFKFPLKDPIAELLNSRAAVAINKSVSEIRTLRSRVDGDDLRYMRRLFFLPVVFRGQEGDIFFSFSADTDIAAGTLLGSLKVQ